MTTNGAKSSRIIAAAPSCSTIHSARMRWAGQTLGFYVVRGGDVEARVALEDVPLLKQLPLDPPRRWLFGARLASCQREEGGVWVLRFEPQSAVLLTDEGAAAVCCPGPMDAELRAVLRRQQEWLER